MKAIALALVTLAVSVTAMANDHDKNIEKCVKDTMKERNIVERFVDKATGMGKAREAVARDRCTQREIDKMSKGKGH